MSANLAFINGRIASELEMKQTNSGKSVMSFSVAVRATEEHTDFVPVTVWGKAAEFVERHFTKGDGINIVGKITTRTWEDDNGNKRKAVEVTGREVGFPDGKKSQNHQTQASNVDELDKASNVEVLEVKESDDDLPF